MRISVWNTTPPPARKQQTAELGTAAVVAR